MRMNERLKLCALAFGILALSSCRTIYYPNLQNVADLQGKNDANIVFNPSNLQASWAFTEHFCLQTNLQFKPSAWSDNPEAVTTDFRADRKLAELALGYTKPFDDQIRFEIGAGAGFGENIFEEERSIIDGPTRYLRYSSQLTKYYFQPALIFRPRPGIGMTFSMRASVLDYYNVQSVNYSFEELSSLNLLDLNVKPHAFAEPAFGINFSKGRLRLQNQIMWIYRVSDTPINHQRLKFSFSLIMKLNGKYLKNTESD